MHASTEPIEEITYQFMKFLYDTVKIPRNNCRFDWMENYKPEKCPIGT
jgi:hypothetical protein